MAFIPKGIIPAMVTPLTRDGKVNEKALRQFIDYLIKGASHGLFVVGTTGEFYGLSPEEKKEPSKSPWTKPGAGYRCTPALGRSPRAKSSSSPATQINDSSGLKPAAIAIFRL